LAGRLTWTKKREGDQGNGGGGSKSQDWLVNVKMRDNTEGGALRGRGGIGLIVEKQ